MNPINRDIIRKISADLRLAEDSRQGLEHPITELYPDITIDQAYEIQLNNIDRKVQEGHKISGKKIGLTSLAMQQMMNVDQPDYGHLLDSMEIKHGDVIDMNRVLQPKVEAELAFVLKKDLVGPKVSVLDVMLATDCIIPSLEIVCSRVKDWKIKLIDTVADNASSGLYILGDKRFTVDQVDLIQTGMSLYKNGHLVNTGVGAAALGNPAYCVAWLANKLYDYGVTLKKGEVILSGALSAAVSVEANDTVTARFSKLGDVSVKFV